MHVTQLLQVYELIQNADDCDYAPEVIPALSISGATSPSALLVASNEKGFRCVQVLVACREVHAKGSDVCVCACSPQSKCEVSL
jgi:hypothetical protein